MATARLAPDVFEQELLPMRAKLLEVAAALDRIDRAAGSAAADPRHRKIQDAIQVLLGTDADRAERVQMIFSRPYEKDWQARFGMTGRT